MFNEYKVKLTLTRDMLGTNPISPDIHAEHIIAKARKIMAGTDPANKKLDRFADAMEISNEKELNESESLIRVLEERLGKKFSDDQRKEMISSKLISLKETVDELDEKGVTVFFRDTAGMPCIGDHMIKGYMKSAGESIASVTDRKNGVLFGTKTFTCSTINQHVTIKDQFITFSKDLKRESSGKPAYLSRSLRGMTAQGPRVSIAKSEVVESGACLEFTLRVLKGSPIDLDSIKKIFDYGQISGLGQWRNSGYGQFNYIISAL